MYDTIRNTVNHIIKNPELQPLNGLNEDQVKTGIIVPLLETAGWDRMKVASEFVPEYPIGSSKVDFALRIDSSNRVFVEAKAASENLHQHQKQLLDYCKSASDAPDLAVLTNGRLWWLYSQDPKSGWEEHRQFCTIDIETDNLSQVQNDFKRFLYKNAVESGSAKNAAGRAYHKLIRDEETGRALIEAWNRIVRKPEEPLIDLIANITEDICKRNPNPKMVRDFLKEHSSKLVVSNEPIPSEQAIGGSRFDANGKKPKSLTFGGNIYEVNSWRSALQKIASLVSVDLESVEGRNFNEVVSINKGSKNAFFAIGGDTLNHPDEIDSTGVYFERNGLGSQKAFNNCKQILRFFKYPESTVTIETEVTDTGETVRVSLP